MRPIDGIAENKQKQNSEVTLTSNRHTTFRSPNPVASSTLSPQDLSQSNKKMRVEKKKNKVAQITLPVSPKPKQNKLANPILKTAPLAIDWEYKSGFYLEKNLFKHGIVLLMTPEAKKRSAKLVTAGSFCEKDRKFVICNLSSEFDNGTESHTNSSEKGQQPILTVSTQLTESEQSDVLDSYSRVAKTHHLLEQLVLGASVGGTIGENQKFTEFTEGTYIVNIKRKEEVFIPVAVDKKSAVYMYPWISKYNKKFKELPQSYQGFTQFVSATCMFGSSLRGQIAYDSGVGIPLIKHDMDYGWGLKIQNISVDPIESSIYDQMVFSELNQLAHSIIKFTNIDKDAHLLLHLPYCDYIFYCLDLFVKGRMTLLALNNAIIEIYERKGIYERKIHDIFGQHNIRVKITSPFESLFQHGELSHFEEEVGEQNLDSEVLAIKLLKQLGLETDEKFYANFNPVKSAKMSEEDHLINLQKSAEGKRKACKKLIQNCLDKLQDENANPHTYNVWRDIVKMQKAKFEKRYKSAIEKHKKSPQEEQKPVLEEIDNFEFLFHMANTVVLAQASNGQQAFETCSILPISEKQIQTTYAEYLDSYSQACNIDNYVPVFNITTMEPARAYMNNNSGLIFYFSSSNAVPIARLFSHKKLLESAHHNALCSITHEQPEELDYVLQISKSPKQEDKFIDPSDIPSFDLGPSNLVLKNFYWRLYEQATEDKNGKQPKLNKTIMQILQDKRKSIGESSLDTDLKTVDEINAEGSSSESTTKFTIL